VPACVVWEVKETRKGCPSKATVDPAPPHLVVNVYTHAPPIQVMTLLLLLLLLLLPPPPSVDGGRAARGAPSSPRCCFSRRARARARGRDGLTWASGSRLWPKEGWVGW